MVEAGLAFALCVAAALVPLTAAPGALSEAGIDSLLSRRYIHGMPRSKLLALGDSALPILARTLRDDSRKGRWRLAAKAIGLLGDTSYFDTLRTFIWGRFSGPLDVPTWLAIRTAQVSMTGIARRSVRATEYLASASTPDPWLGLAWSFQGDTREYQARLMAKESIQALSYVDNERAYAYIDSLEYKQYPERGTPVFIEAKRISELVRVKGTLKVWEEEEKEPGH